MAKRGKFIVLEGIDGCGKDKQSILLAENICKQDSYSLIFLTREPNKLDQAGIETKYMLTTTEDPTQSALRDVRGYCMNRSTHNTVFNPLLDIGIDVISKRYYHSTCAYQHAQGLDYQIIANLNVDFTVPDLTMIIDVPVEESLKRIGYDERRKRERFEREEFLEKVRANYLELPEVLPKLMNDNSIRIIDGIGSVEEVWERIYETVKKEGILTT